MTAPALIPANFLKRAREHLKRTGRPLVYGPRRQGDIRILAEQNTASQRWVLLVDPVRVLGDECVISHRERGEVSNEIMARLAKYAAVVVKDCIFECDGQRVGRVDTCDGMVFVSDALALSCLSYILRHPRSGFFLRVLGPD